MPHRKYKLSALLKLLAAHFLKHDQIPEPATHSTIFDLKARPLQTTQPRPIRLECSMPAIVQAIRFQGSFYYADRAPDSRLRYFEFLICFEQPRLEFC